MIERNNSEIGFTETDIYVNAPNLTYQYSKAGEIATSAGSKIGIAVRRVPQDFRPPHHTHHDLIVDLIDDIPAAYKEEIISRWQKKGWERLQELTKALLAKLPENAAVQESAWIVGLHPDGGSYIAKLRQRYADSKTAVEAEIDRATAKQNRIQELEALLKIEILRQETVKHNEGVDYRASVQIDGKVYVCRNIFDVGYVIHPPSGKGVALENKWWTSDGEEQLMSPDELLAVEYLRLRPPVSAGLNM